MVILQQDHLYNKGNGFCVDVLEEIKNKIIQGLKDEFVITFKEVKVIEATKSGKPQIIQSFI